MKDKQIRKAREKWARNNPNIPIIAIKLGIIDVPQAIVIRYILTHSAC